MNEFKPVCKHFLTQRKWDENYREDDRVIKPLHKHFHTQRGSIFKLVHKQKDLTYSPKNSPATDVHGGSIPVASSCSRSTRRQRGPP